MINKVITKMTVKMIAVLLTLMMIKIIKSDTTTFNNN